MDLDVDFLGKQGEADGEKEKCKPEVVARGSLEVTAMEEQARRMRIDFSPIVKEPSIIKVHPCFHKVLWRESRALQARDTASPIRLGEATPILKWRPEVDENHIPWPRSLAFQPSVRGVQKRSWMSPHVHLHGEA